MMRTVEATSKEVFVSINDLILYLLSLEVNDQQKELLEILTKKLTAARDKSHK